LLLLFLFLFNLAAQIDTLQKRNIDAFYHYLILYS
jgi:hypothetical protein